MSRIRSIHPGIWTDEGFMTLSANARLLLFGIWNEAFDDGVFEWKPLTLKARIFPVDAVDVESLLSELVSASFIMRDDDHPKRPGLVRNFQRYQRPKKPNSSGMLSDQFREFVGAKAENAEPVGNQLRTGGEEVEQMEDGGGRREGEKETASQSRGARDFDGITDKLLKAANLDDPQSMRSPALINIAPIIGLLDADFDLEADIIPAISFKAAAGFVFRSWTLVPEFVHEFVAKRNGVKALGSKPKAPDPQWEKRIAQWRIDGHWPYSLGPEPGQPGCQVPAEFLVDAA